MTEQNDKKCRAFFEEDCERELLCIEELDEPGAPPHRNYGLWLMCKAAWGAKPIGEVDERALRAAVGYHFRDNTTVEDTIRYYEAAKKETHHE